VQAGAKHVYGIECSAIADQAKQIVEDNGYSDKVTIIKGKVRLRCSVNALRHSLHCTLADSVFCCYVPGGGDQLASGEGGHHRQRVDGLLPFL